MKSQAQAPELWVGQDVMVVLAPDATMDLTPEVQSGAELTLGLESVNVHGVILKQDFRDPNTGSRRIDNIFYPWTSIKRIRPTGLPQ